MQSKIQENKSMNTKQLKYVLLLAELGSFSASAAELGISQPSLSQYIKKIENQMGITLFERANGNVRLTDAGRVYVEHGRKILNLEHQMEMEFADIAANKRGSVIIGTSPYRSAGMMPEITKTFREKFPGIHLVVEEMTSSELISKMEKGAFDICLTVLPVDEKMFSFTYITEEEMILAVPAGGPVFKTSQEPNRKYPAIDIREIDGNSFVMITNAQLMQQALNQMCKTYNLKLKKAAVVKSLEAQIHMVRSGVGMAVVPSGIERFCNADEVRFYSFVQKLPRRKVVLMWRKDNRPVHIVKKLVATIKGISW